MMSECLWYVPDDWPLVIRCQLKDSFLQKKDPEPEIPFDEPVGRDVDLEHVVFFTKEAALDFLIEDRFSRRPLVAIDGISDCMALDAYRREALQSIFSKLDIRECEKIDLVEEMVQRYPNKRYRQDWFVFENCGLV